MTLICICNSYSYSFHISTYNTYFFPKSFSYLEMNDSGEAIEDSKYDTRTLNDDVKQMEYERKSIGTQNLETVYNCIHSISHES